MEPESKKNIIFIIPTVKKKEDDENWITLKTDKNVNYYSMCFVRYT